MPVRPRLLVLASTYPRWSEDPEPAFVHELARRLGDRFEVHVLCPHAQGAKLREQMDGVYVHRYRYAPQRFEVLVNDGGMLANVRRSSWKWLLVPGFIFSQWVCTLILTRKIRPAAVHAHWLLPQGLIAAATVKTTPLVVTAHGADLFALRGLAFERLRAWVVRRASAITLVSQAMRQRLLKEIPGSDVSVLSMGVDTSVCFTPGTDREESELLFVGRLVEKKGLMHLVAALPAVVTQCPRITLSIVGDGPEKERLQKQVCDLGLQDHVRFLGALPQARLPEYYRRATIFVAPFVEAASGDQEGLGLVVAEAMACGCPVIVGDVQAVRDLVNDQTGLIVYSSNHSVLAQAIITLLNDPLQRVILGGAGRRHVEQHFSWDAVSSQYGDLLLGIIAGRSR